MFVVFAFRALRYLGLTTPISPVVCVRVCTGTPIKNWWATVGSNLKAFQGRGGSDCRPPKQRQDS